MTQSIHLGTLVHLEGQGSMFGDTSEGGLVLCQRDHAYIAVSVGK